MPTSTPQGEPVHPGWPADVGILAIEIYFPSQFVDQVTHHTLLTHMTHPATRQKGWQGSSSRCRGPAIAGQVTA